MAALHQCDGLLKHEDDPSYLNRKVRIQFEKTHIKSHLAKVNDVYPIDFTDIKWKEIARKSADTSLDIYNESLFDIIELNCPNYEKFQSDSEKVIGQLRDQNSDLHVRLILLTCIKIIL